MMSSVENEHITKSPQFPWQPTPRFVLKSDGNVLTHIARRFQLVSANFVLKLSKGLAKLSVFPSQCTSFVIFVKPHYQANEDTPYVGIATKGNLLDVSGPKKMACLFRIDIRKFVECFVVGRANPLSKIAATNIGPGNPIIILLDCPVESFSVYCNDQSRF